MKTKIFCIFVIISCVLLSIAIYFKSKKKEEGNIIVEESIFPEIPRENSIYIVLGEKGENTNIGIVTKNGQLIIEPEYTQGVQVSGSIASVAMGGIDYDLNKERESDTWKFYDKIKLLFELDCDNVHAASSNLIGLTEIIFEKKSKARSIYSFIDYNGANVLSLDSTSQISDSFSENILLISEKLSPKQPRSRVDFINVLGYPIHPEKSDHWIEGTNYQNGIAIVINCGEIVPSEKETYYFGKYRAHERGPQCDDIQIIGYRGEEINDKFTPFWPENFLGGSTTFYERINSLLLEDGFIFVTNKRNIWRGNNAGSISIMTSTGELVAEGITDWIPSIYNDNKFGFSNGVSPARYKEGDISEDNQLVGFVDQYGEWIIDPTYKKVSRFIDGRALAVTKDSVGIMIDKEGNRIGECVFSSLNANISEGRCIAEININESIVLDLNCNIIRSGLLSKSKADHYLKNSKQPLNINIPHYYKFVGERALVRSVEGWELIDLDGNPIWKAVDSSQ